jgi:hypothetical protein
VEGYDEDALDSAEANSSECIDLIVGAADLTQALAMLKFAAITITAVPFGALLSVKITDINKCTFESEAIIVRHIIDAVELFSCDNLSCEPSFQRHQAFLDRPGSAHFCNRISQHRCRILA